MSLAPTYRDPVGNPDPIAGHNVDDMAVLTQERIIRPRRELLPTIPATGTCYAVTVDTEEEWDWADGFPTGEPSVENIHRLPAFQQVCDQYNAAVTYYCNYAVVADPTSRAIIQELAQKPNVEIGLHIHPWNTPPMRGSQQVTPRESFLHNLPWRLCKAKIDATLEAFDDAGLRPTSFRGGRYSTSPRIQDYLRDHGILVDASVLPYTTWSDDGAPDFRHRNLTPIRHEPRSPDDAALWELPLTFGYSRRPFALWERMIRGIENSPLRHLRLIGLMDQLAILRKEWLNLENPMGHDIPGFLQTLARIRPPFICFTLHSSSLMPGGSPYTRSIADADRILESTALALRAVAQYPGFSPATVTQTALHLETIHNARVGNQPAG